MGLFVKSGSGWTAAKSIFVKSGAGWTSVKKIFIKASTGMWQLFWPKTGPYATVSPTFSSDTAGNNTYFGDVIFGSTLYGQRGTWTSNSSYPISSYSYSIYTSDSSTGNLTLVSGPISLSGTYQSINSSNTLYDGKYIVFEVTANDTEVGTGTLTISGTVKR